MSVQRNKAFLSLFQNGAEHRDAAIAYASCQLFVIPLQPGKKEPAIKQWQHEATTNLDKIKSWWPVGSDRNIGIYLQPSCVVVIDVDPRNGGTETFERMLNDYGHLPQTYTVKTAGDGLHFYFRVPVDFYDEVTYPQNLGPGVELLINKYVVAPPSELVDGKQYAITTGSIEDDFSPLPFDWLDDVCHSRAVEIKDTWHEDREDWAFPVGKRNSGMAQVAGYLRRAWFKEEEIAEILEVLGRNGRFDPFDHEALEATKSVARSIARRPGELRITDISVSLRRKAQKPQLDEKALYGPIGEFVKYLEPITEAHPAALLGQSLAVFGNLIGGKQQDDPGPGFEVEDAHHKTALYVMLVGDSAQAAKGDSWSRVINLFKRVDYNWKYRSGIQTGEAVIHQLADDEEQEEVTLINGQPTPHVKKGATDKRFLVYEPEFVRILHVSQRQGSIVKDILRTMWDTGETERIAASSQQKVTNGTLSIVGHITKADLERELPDVDLVNGFANRFLYVHAERTKFLTSAPPIPQKDLNILAAPFHDALEFAQEAPSDYQFTPDARDLFNEYGLQWYHAGKKPMPAIEDQLSGRARPLVRRMAVIYAVTDCSDFIEVRHLVAAKAFWDYCIDSVTYIFGNRIGDRDADKLYRALLEHTPGLNMTEISRNVFNSNRSKASITRTINLLVEKNLIKVRKMKAKNKTISIFFAIPQTEVEA